jgi:RimJ/RimL family protein N-acetyltransferase
VPLPEIRTQRFLMRPWTLADVDALHALWTAPEVRRYLWDDVVIPRETVIEIVESHLATSEQHGFGYWAVCDPSLEAAIAGFCGFRFIDDGPEIEILYGLRGEYWGKGLATEVCRAALDYLWRSTSFERVYARTDVPNEKSVGVMRRLGMRHESASEMITYVVGRGESPKAAG